MIFWFTSTTIKSRSSLQRNKANSTPFSLQVLYILLKEQGSHQIGMKISYRRKASISVELHHLCRL